MLASLMARTEGDVGLIVASTSATAAQPARLIDLPAEQAAAVRARIRMAHALDHLTAAQRRTWLDEVEADHAARTGRGDRQMPTAETARKFRRCVVARLAGSVMRYADTGRTVLDSRGEPRFRLDNEQVLAAIEIEEHFLAIGRGLWARASAYDVVSTSGRHLRDPVAQLSDREVERMSERYMPWATIEGRRPVARGSTTMTLEIVIDAIIDNVGPAQLEARHRLRHGRGYRTLHASLARYCRIAGWREPEPLPQRAVGGYSAQEDEALQAA